MPHHPRETREEHKRREHVKALLKELRPGLEQAARGEFVNQGVAEIIAEARQERKR
jgi:hypothetical protein